MQELTLAVVGIDYANPYKARSNRRPELMMTLPGEPVELRPEPRNPHDPQAVAVWSARGIQLGYLSAERAPWIGARLRAGEEAQAVFQGLAGSAAYIRVRFGGGAPTLPAMSSRRPPEDRDPDDFYPDPPAPDWGA